MLHTRIFGSIATNGDNKLQILHLKALKMVIWITQKKQTLNSKTQEANINMRHKINNETAIYWIYINLNNVPWPSRYYL